METGENGMETGEDGMERTIWRLKWREKVNFDATGDEGV